MIPTLSKMTCFALYSASHAMQRVYQPMLAPLGLTFPQYLVLVTLWEADDRSVGDLGRAMFLESNTLTPLLKRMEVQGLVARHRSITDERQVRVRLTEKGQALKAKAEAIGDGFFERCGTEAETLLSLRAEVAALRDRLQTRL
jgi:MarR family transcriptional regulator, organic hydroperoxide resistance regulator